MRLPSLYEAFGLVFFWSLLSFFMLDEEPIFDFSDWNLTHVILLGLGFFSFSWENILRSRSGAYVYKDLVLLYATFFFVYSLERYMQLVQIVFFCHCLAPLEIDLMDSVEVFLEYFAIASAYLSVSVVWVTLLSLIALLGAINLSFGRLVFSRLLASVVCIGLALSWLVVGWDLSINSLSLLDIGGGSSLLYAHSPTSLTYNSISNNIDQFDWHKEQVRPFMVRFEAFYLFAMQLFLFLTLGLGAWVWGLISLDSQGTDTRAITFWGLGIRNLTHIITTNLISFVLLGLPYLRVFLHIPYEYYTL